MEWKHTGWSLPTQDCDFGRAAGLSIHFASEETFTYGLVFGIDRNVAWINQDFLEDLTWVPKINVENSPWYEIMTLSASKNKNNQNVIIKSYFPPLSLNPVHFSCNWITFPPAWMVLLNLYFMILLRGEKCRYSLTREIKYYEVRVCTPLY